jgi:DNA helicase-2/ATP-dependent DNA helicase PcrA
MFTKTSSEFKRLYRGLDTEQKKAVDAVEGPVMVIAGPGTGKTHLLTLRIANILRLTDTSPDSILALTFTESAAHSMHKRLIEIIGSAAYRVHISTFHSFCNEIIGRFPEEFERIIGARNASVIDQINILEELIKNKRLKFLKPYGNPFYYINDILSAISELKREGVDTSTLARHIATEEKAFLSKPDLYYEEGRYRGKMRGVYREMEKHIYRSKEMLALYRGYEKSLSERGLYDYEDMIMETISVLERNESLLLRLQEQYQYILADEHQDANYAQNRLLELLSSFHENPNLFVVGDEKQAIFRFQGASLHNFFSFFERYPEALVVHLKKNYRSSQFILDGAHSVIVNNPVPDTRLRPRLVSCRKEKGLKIRLWMFSKPENEHMFVADEIEHRLRNNVSPKEIAVLYRNNHDVFDIASELEKRGILFSIASEQNVLADGEIRKLILLFRAVCDLGNEELVAKTMFVDFLKILPLDAYKIISYAKNTKSSLLNVARSKKKLKEIGVEDPASLNRFFKGLFSWNTLAHNRWPLDMIEILARESGFIAHALTLPNSHEVIRKLDSFVSYVAQMMPSHREHTLSDVLSYLDVLEKYRVPVRTRGDHGEFLEGIQLMTAHKAKGLEFDHVFIIGAADGHWGNKRATRLIKIPGQFPV